MRNVRTAGVCLALVARAWTGLVADSAVATPADGTTRIASSARSAMHLDNGTKERNS